MTRLGFFGEPGLVENSPHPSEAFAKSSTEGGERVGSALADSIQERAHERQAMGKIVRDGLPLLPAHDVEIVECNHDRGTHGVSRGLRVPSLRRDEKVGHRRQHREGDVRTGCELVAQLDERAKRLAGALLVHEWERKYIAFYAHADVAATA